MRCRGRRCRPGESSTSSRTATSPDPCTSTHGIKRRSATDDDFARFVDPALDAVRTVQGEIRGRGRDFDAEVLGLRNAEAKLGALRHATDGPAVYPDTTGTFRLGYGRVTAYERAPRAPTVSPVPWYRLPAASTVNELYRYARHNDNPLGRQTAEMCLKRPGSTVLPLYIRAHPGCGRPSAYLLEYYHTE